MVRARTKPYNAFDLHDGFSCEFVFFGLKKFIIFFLFVITMAVNAAKTKDINSDTASKSSDLIPRGKREKSLPINTKYTK
jgi:hypothetical protein